MNWVISRIALSVLTLIVVDCVGWSYGADIGWWGNMIILFFIDGLVYVRNRYQLD